MFTRLESRRRSEARSLRPTIVAGLSRVRRRAEPGQTGSKSRHTIGLATTGVLQRPVPGCSIDQPGSRRARHRTLESPATIKGGLRSTGEAFSKDSFYCNYPGAKSIQSGGGRPDLKLDGHG